VEYEDHTSPSIYVKFPFDLPPQLVWGLVSGEPSLVEGIRRISIVIWTTTPWTLPANQAVCLHPSYKYAFVRVQDEILVIAEDLVGRALKECGIADYKILLVCPGGFLFGIGTTGSLKCHRPFSDGLSPLLLGDFVTLDQGTGCVHIAPGHGQEDYVLVMQHNVSATPGERLEIVAPVDGAGRFTDAVPDFSGQQVLKANPAIVEKLRTLGVLLGDGKVSHSYPHCWRCKSPVIFRATEQWFVSMEINELRQQALNEIERITWIPSWGRDRIHGMIMNRPDWCLSRQRVWGVPIPGFTCTACGEVLKDPAVISHVADLVAKQGADLWFQKSAGELIPPGTACPKCGGRAFEKERDILDVWFESGISHAAVLKPRQWWPADLYLEGSDQHRGWFHSALLTSVTTENKAPYKAVLTHGFVVDGAGKKMSKSAGNVVAPQDVIKQSGAEVLRLWVSAQDYREDLRISPEILGQLVEAYRKIRNTCRFLLSNLYDFDPALHRVPFERLSELDRWALLRLGELIPRVKKAYEEFEFHAIFHALNNFCSVDMSAVYLDILKDRLYTFHRDSPLRRGSQTVLYDVLATLTKLMAPILSFTAEEIWRMLPEEARGQGTIASVHLASFPTPDPKWANAELAQRWDRLLEIRTTVQAALEAQRRDKVIGSSLEAQVTLHAETSLLEFLKPHQAELPSLFIVSQAVLVPSDGSGLKVDVRKASGNKCERCWNYRESVGNCAEHPTICDRCVEAVR
ncbi:MAG: isoleucine--tRNA ligase, partial [Nitrospirae bacterium]